MNALKDFFADLLQKFIGFFLASPSYPEAAHEYFLYLKFGAILLGIVAGVVIARKLSQRRYKNLLSRRNFWIACVLWLIVIPIYLGMYFRIPTPAWWQKLIEYALFFYLNALPACVLTVLALMPGGAWDRAMAWRAKTPKAAAKSPSRQRKKSR